MSYVVTLSWEQVPMFDFKMGRLVASAAFALTAACLAPGLQGARAAAVLPAYFNPGDAAPFAPMVILRQAPPPVDNDQYKSTYAYGPITDSASQNLTAQNNSTWTGGHSWPFVWA